jgi:dihydroxyacid dehydratase/phosphogluconate dehydratase
MAAMKNPKSSNSLRPHSSILLDGPERAAARAMLYPVGFKAEDFKKPLIGIASTWGNTTPCNMHIDKLALESEKGANAAGGKAIIFNTITISDGISMGSEGMKYSLVSREVIADSIETVVGCAGMDGFVAIGGCDKNMPGSIIAMARLNRPSVFVYGGTILPGCITGDTRKLDIVSVFEAIGGIRPLMKTLLDKGLLHGDALTVTGETMAQTLASVKPYPAGQTIIQPFEKPVKKDSHLVILRGNLASEGAVAKISGKEGLKFSGNARVFNSEEAALEKILDGSIVKGDVIVIRYEGPRGGPGMREMLSPTSAIMGKGLGKDVALITDGRFSGGSHGFVVGHITPEAYSGGAIGLVKNGDTITIDAEKRELTLEITGKEMATRRKTWKKPAPRYTRGVLAKYAAHVTSASFGAVTDMDLKL